MEKGTFEHRVMLWNMTRSLPFRVKSFENKS